MTKISADVMVSAEWFQLYICPPSCFFLDVWEAPYLIDDSSTQAEEMQVSASSCFSCCMQ
jgi:hypothetical protein